MGVDPPFLYDQPSRYSFVGPTDKASKTVSQASWNSTSTSSKNEKPIATTREVNRHPDSYYVAPYGNLDWKPMSPNTKKKIKWVRILLLSLRILALLGAAGLLFCVVCLKPTEDPTDWIMRIPPGIAILHTLYAVYHLSRSSNKRTPATTASYMIFAAVIDSGLIPFCVFTAMMAQPEYTNSPSVSNVWQTLFQGERARYMIVFTTFISSIAVGGLLLLCLPICIYLAIQFRKISKMPPDMNPLEDNLTSRHKRNKSSFSVMSGEVSNSKDLHLSAPLMDPPRSMPFIQTRPGSYVSLSGTQQRSAASNRASQSSLPHSPIYSPLPSSERSSRHDVSSPTRRQDRSSAGSHGPSPYRSSAASSLSPSTYTSAATSPVTSPYHSRHPSPDRASKHHPRSRPGSAFDPAIHALQHNDDNWIRYPSPPTSPDHAKTATPPELQHLRSRPDLSMAPSPSMTPSLSTSPIPQLPPSPRRGRPDFHNRSPRPLQMHPPTPTLTPLSDQGTTPRQRALLASSGNANYNSSPATWEEQHFEPADSTVTVPKSRYFGDLRHSVHGGGAAGLGQTRVVSSSGVDEALVSGPRTDGMRAREVSGKVAEEGRGSFWGRAGELG